MTGKLYMNSIGSYDYGNYIGAADEMRVYNRILLPSEIEELYQNDLANSMVLPHPFCSQLQQIVVQ